MNVKSIKVNKNKSGSGSISNRIILPSEWVKTLSIEDVVIAEFDKKNKLIIIKKE